MNAVDGGSDARTALCQVLVVGVGGQGVLTAAKMLGAAAHAAGLPLMVGQLHGMSQRGGSVQCTIRIGVPCSSSFIIGAADVVVGFEPIECLRVVDQVGSNTRVVLNCRSIIPQAMVRDRVPYPASDEVVAQLRAAGAEVMLVDGPALTRSVGVPRTLNVGLLGATAGLDALPFDETLLWRGVESCTPMAFRAANRRAFELGLEETKARAPSDLELGVPADLPVEDCK